MEKVSFVQAINKTHTLISTRKGIYGLYAFLLFVLNMWAESFTLESASDEAALSQAGFALIAFFLMFLADISLLHFSVSANRGQTSFFPRNPIWAVIQYVLSSIAVSVVAGGVAGLGILPASMLTALFEEGAMDPSMAALGAAVLFMVACLFLSLYLAVRLGLSLVAAAAGDPSGLKDAWRMTKGYSFKLMFLGLVAAVMFIGSEFGVAWLFNNNVLEPSMGVIIANTLVFVFLLLWFESYVCVLYTDLEKNYTASIMARSKGDTPTDQQASFTLTES